MTPISTAIRDMVQPIEQLRDKSLTEAAVLGGNPFAITNHFTNIIAGLHSIIGSYEQVILGYLYRHVHLLFFRSVLSVHKSEHK